MRSGLPNLILRYQQAVEVLRRVNLDAGPVVLAIAYTHADARVCRRWCEKLDEIVLKLELLLEACINVVSGGFNASPAHVEFRVVPPHDCPCPPPQGTVLENEGLTVPIAAVEPGWDAELDVLLEFAVTAVDGLAASEGLRAKGTGRAVASLRRLYRVLVRQRQHVSLMATRPARLDFVIATKCPECGQDV